MKETHGNWTALFSRTILSRGKSYYQSGKAKKLIEENDGFSLTVRGSRNYTVHIGTDYFGDLESLSCTCPYAAEGEYCKHMAAALYYLENYFGEPFCLNEEAESRLFSSKSTVSTLAGASVASRTTKSGASAAARDAASTHNAASAASTRGTAQGASKDAKSRAPQKAQTAASKKEGGAGPVGKRSPVSTGYFSDIEKMQKSELATRQQEAPSSPFVPSDYRYFNNPNYLSDIKSRESDRKKARTLVNNKDCDDIKVRLAYREGTSQEDIIGEATWSAEPDSYYDSNTVRLTFNRQHILSSTCSGWRCRNARYYGSDDYACEHQIAAIYLLQDYLRINNPGDSTNLSGIRFLTGITGDIKADTADVVPSLTITPYLTRDENGISACFRVGAGKLYKIKNLPEFSKTVASGGQMLFGTKTDLTLGKEYIKPESVKWMTFIDNFLAREQIELKQFTARLKHSNYYSYSIPETKDSIDLTGQILDDFFDTAIGDLIEYTDKTGLKKDKRNLRFRLRDLPVTLKISASRGPGNVIDGILMTGDLPEIIKGINRRYYITEDALNCIPEERSAALKAVLDAEHGGYVRIMIGRRYLPNFYHKVLPSLREIVHIESSENDEELIRTILPPEPEFITYLDVDSGNLVGRVDVYYDNTRFALADLLNGDSPESFRSLEAEGSMLELLLRYLPHYDPSYRILFAPKDAELTFDLLDRGIPEILQRSEVRMTDRFKALKVRNRSKFDIGLSVESNLLDISVTSSDLSPEELLDILYSYKKKKKFITLKNGDFFKLDDNESIAQLVEMMEALHVSPKEFVTGKMHIPAYRALYLDKMMEASQDIYATRDSRFKSLIKEFKTIEDADFEVPKTLKSTLRKYQSVGYRWLRTLDAHSFGGILADDMGLGKTLQVITVLLAVKNENPGNSRPALIVTPASLVYNWREELAAFAPSLAVSLIAGTAKERAGMIAAWRDNDVLVTSYDLLKRDISEYEGKQFRFLVADEAQYVKNRTTAAAKSLKLVKADTRFALTGTPIENRLGELWSIFDYLMPGLLYSYDDFRTGFEAPIMKSENEEIREQLRKMVTPFILRRKKADVLKDLPDKLEEVRYAHMESKQQKLYDGQVVRMRKKLQSTSETDFRKGKIEILAELTHIRQICCDPSLMLEDYDGKSAKRELCLELIDSLIDGDHRALIFSQFTSMLEKLEEDLKKRGIEYYKITGATPKAKRMELVKAFNEGTVPLFLISLKAGGTGLNLTGADVVIHYDPWWNTAVQDQATDRAHRIGQTKIVNVYKLIVKGTIEEKIVEMQMSKQKLADDILSGEGVASAALSREDLLELLA